MFKTWGQIDHMRPTRNLRARLMATGAPVTGKRRVTGGGG